MFIIHSNVSSGEYYAQLTASSAAIAMERLSDIGLRAWLKCLAGHKPEFEWKYPNLSDDEKFELVDQGFLAPMGSDYKDCEFDPMGGYGAAQAQPEPICYSHTGYTQRTKAKEPEPTRGKNSSGRSEICFRERGENGLEGKYEGNWFCAVEGDGMAVLHDWSMGMYIPTGYTWEEAVAMARANDDPDSRLWTYGDDGEVDEYGLPL